MMFIAFLGTCLNHSPLCFFCIATFITSVLLRYYPHHHHLVGGVLVVHHVVHFPLTSTHHCHFPLVLHGEVLPLPIALFKWWSSFILETKQKKCESFNFLLYICHIFLFVFLWKKFFLKFFSRFIVGLFNNYK